jgi:hypothetical protein
MKSRALCVGVLLLLSSSGLCQSYDLTIHLRNGETVTIANDDIRRIEFALATGVPDPADPSFLPRGFLLLQNFPNPFNPSTTIAYEIPAMADVTVRIFDLQGALTKELLHETQPAGRHQVTWNGTDGDGARVASGAYVYAVACGEQTLCRQLILVK